MPKKRKTKNNLTRLREGLGLSQPDFARRFGVSASIIKKLEAGTRTITNDLSSRIFAETGIMLLPGPEEVPLEYAKADHEAWKKEVLLDSKSVKAAERVLMKLIEVMMAASVRPGVEKSYVVFNGLIQAIERVKNEFQMEKHIDAELRDRQATETKLYSVRELRQNDLLAKQVGFKDDPKLKDDQEIPMTKSVGWLPARELFNVSWQHKEFIKELASSGDGELTEAQKTKLADMQQQLNTEVDAFLPNDLR
jgi:transcriptional regulator with XRE-family HTH domain